MQHHEVGHGLLVGERLQTKLDGPVVRGVGHDGRHRVVHPTQRLRILQRPGDGHKRTVYFPSLRDVAHDRIGVEPGGRLVDEQIPSLVVEEIHALMARRGHIGF